MKIKRKKNYIILEDQKDDVVEFSAFLYKNQSKFKKDNVVINILKYGNLSLEELLNFLELSNLQRNRKKSFVIVNDTINIDNVPEELMVVPTLQEAEDIVNMEELERELGF
ncbi:MAG: ribonuclease Z [Gillisia sp.]